MRRLFWGLAFTFCVGSALGITRRDDVADSDYTTAANGSAFDAVAQLTRGTDITSGVLVDGLWLLTAAHVIDPNGNGIPNHAANAFTIDFTGGEQRQSVQLVLNPDWIAEGTASWTNGNDIALIRLDSPVTTITPMQLYGGTTEAGTTADLVGYGQGGTGTAGGSGARGTKRAGTNVIDTASLIVNPGSPSEIDMSHGRLLFYDFDDGTAPENPLGSSAQTTRESMVAIGDSGGALISNLGGQDQLVGIHSAVLGDGDSINYNYGDIGASTRVSSHSSWILSVIPEPSSSSLFLFGLLWVYLKKRL